VYVFLYLGFFSQLRYAAISFWWCSYSWCSKITWSSAISG